jgi:diacylglycerol kinase (ATP)
MDKPKAGWQRWLNAIKYSHAGFQSAWKNEAAFREEIMLAIVLIPLALWLGKTHIERALLIGSILLVLIVELLNSAIEAIVDLTSPEFHILAGRAKDMGSAAVSVSLMLATIIWLLIIFI